MSGRRIMTADEIRRAVVRISHEIVEKQAGTDGLVLVGIQRRGVPLARRIADAIGSTRAWTSRSARWTSPSTATTSRCVAQQPVVKGTELPFDLNGTTVVLVDDVLYTGRTIRAAMDALVDFGRPQAIRLAVLVDRGHRELPIRADHVGKNVPTSREELVRVRSTRSTARTPWTSSGSMRGRSTSPSPMSADAGRDGHHPPAVDRPRPHRRRPAAGATATCWTWTS